MKRFITLFLVLFPILLFAQVGDSTAVLQVDSLNQLSEDLISQKDYDKALEINAQAEKIAIEKLGEESASYGSCCFIRGTSFEKKREYSEAEKWYLKSIAIREKALGKEHPVYATSLYNLGRLYLQLGRYEKSESLFLESKEIRDKVLGNEHPDYAETLHILANLNLITGRYEKAEAFYLEAIKIREKALGKESPVLAGSVNNLAVLYMTLGQFEKAEPLYHKSRTIREKTLGKEHPQYAGSLNNLAILYVNMGQFEKAEPLHLEAISIKEKTLGREHPGYATNLSNLGVLYVNMDQYEKAEALHLESKAIREKILGKEHPDYAMSLNNLAILYLETGQFKKAEPLYLESKSIYEKVLGSEHPDFARSLDNLAILYLNMGQFEKAESLYLESKEILRKALGEEHPDYARTLDNLAEFYAETGQFKKAEPLYLESKSMWQKALGNEHPDYARSLDHLSVLYLYTEQYEKAEPLFLELPAVNKHLIESAMLHLSEKELSNYMGSFSKLQDRLLSFTQLTKSEKLVPQCFDNSLFYKGFLLQSASRIKHLALTNKATTETLNQLKGCQRRLADQYGQPILERDSALIAALETQANDLEKELARTVAGWDGARRQVYWKDVQAGLKEGEAAVEFVHYKYYNKKIPDSTMYGALVLKAGNSLPAFIPLFEERQLDSLIQTHGGRKADYVNALYTVSERGLRPSGTPKKSLYELIWKPMEEELGSIRTIYFSPSGLLHRLNLTAIPITDEENLGERYHLIGINSTRILVIPDTSSPDSLNTPEKPGNAILYGGINFEMDSTAIALANQSYNTDQLASRGELSFSSSNQNNRGGGWGYLKWTEKEINKVEETLINAGFQTSTLNGYHATEESFKSIGQDLPSPRILHLATHGFFFPDPAFEKDQSIVKGNSEPVFKMSDHPMIRSGLILAGANHAWRTGKSFQPDMEDGILTAYEISQVNLSNTELVVLSACETGLGDIEGNEGVYGLQRAFKIAGAKYLIMSLWQVPDYQTQELMDTFYTKWLENTMSIPDAFHSAQQEMKEKYQNPYFWAGFVLVE